MITPVICTVWHCNTLALYDTATLWSQKLACWEAVVCLKVDYSLRTVGFKQFIGSKRGNQTRGDVFDSSFKAQSWKIERLFHWNVAKETFELWALSLETAFENFTPSGIGCTARSVEDETKMATGMQNEILIELPFYGSFRIFKWKETQENSFMIPIRILFCFPMTILSLIFHGTGCTIIIQNHWIILESYPPFVHYKIAKCKLIRSTLQHCVPIGWGLQDTAVTAIEPLGTTLTLCNMLQHSAVHCCWSLVKGLNSDCNTVPSTATHCNAQECSAIHCNWRQRTATACDSILTAIVSHPRQRSAQYNLAHTSWTSADAAWPTARTFSFRSISGWAGV